MVGAKRLVGGRNNRVTDLYVAPEGIASLRNLSFFQVEDQGSAPDTFLRGPSDRMTDDLLNAPQGTPMSIHGIRIHELHELGNPSGTDAEYNALIKTLGGSLAGGGDTDFCVALNLAQRDSFVMPVREEMSMFEDPFLHRQQRAGVYGWMEQGFAVLDSRRVQLGSY
jgi:hypothetical protein